MDWGQELKKWHEVAVTARIKQPYSTGRTPWMLRLYPFPTDNCIVWIEPDGLGDVAREKLKAVAKALRELNPSAVMMQSDGWCTSSDKFSARFGIDPNLPYEKYQKEYLRVLNRDFNGSAENLPPDVRGEGITTTIKGPNFASITRVTYYHADDQDKFVPENRTAETDYVNNLIPDWWPVTVQ